MMNKKAIEFSFSWMFAILVGGVIIFLAVYASNEYVKTEQISQDTRLGKEFGIILTPAEADLESSKITKISMSLDTRVYNECTNSGTFGLQKISTATKSLNDVWSSKGFSSSFADKYLFSEKMIEGKNYNVLSKPLEAPFKISNLIYIWAENKNYCFVNPPREIELELNDLKTGFSIVSSVSECPKDSEKICFTSSNCDIDVSLDLAKELRGSVKKKFSDRVYFESSELLYAAIFSDPEIYECQLKRLMKRASELGGIYYSKSTLLSSKGCSSNLESNLAEYINKTFSLENSNQIRPVYLVSEEIRRKNDALSCKLF